MHSYINYIFNSSSWPNSLTLPVIDIAKLKMQAPNALKLKIAKEAKRKRKNVKQDSFEQDKQIVHLEPRLLAIITPIEATYTLEPSKKGDKVHKTNSSSTTMTLSTKTEN